MWVSSSRPPLHFLQKRVRRKDCLAMARPLPVNRQERDRFLNCQRQCAASSDQQHASYLIVTTAHFPHEDTGIYERGTITLVSQTLHSKTYRAGSDVPGTYSSSTIHIGTAQFGQIGWTGSFGSDWLGCGSDIKHPQRTAVLNAPKIPPQEKIRAYSPYRLHLVSIGIGSWSRSRTDPLLRTTLALPALFRLVL
jgi:hypothetical protein